eukprot:11175246-Ditylum_brightwellii.AAC.1
MCCTTHHHVLKEKQCNQIKGGACSDGRKQREMIPKEDATSPTVAPELVLITSIIDAKENRDVTTTDIPGTYLNAETDDYVIM